MIHGSFFSGIGGFDLAAEWMGWENRFHVEINPFCQRILKHYWPNATSYGDIKTTDFTKYKGSIDIVSGGFPCQPYSTAGKRLGKADDRHLWPEMLRAIREIEPTWVVGENVSGLVNWNGGMVFDEVQADLEAEGYEVAPFILPAASVNAPHRRDRVFFIAHSAVFRCRRELYKRKTIQREQQAFRETGECNIKATPYSSNPGTKGLQQTGQNRVRETVSSADSTDNRRKRESRRRRIGDKRRFIQEGFFAWCQFIRGSNITSNTSGERLSRPICREQRSIQEEANSLQGSEFGGVHAAKTRWQDFPTQSPVCSGNDGFSSGLDIDSVFEGVGKPKRSTAYGRWRNESIKGYGNAVVPPLIYEIFKVIQEIHDTWSKH